LRARTSRLGSRLFAALVSGLLACAGALAGDCAVAGATVAGCAGANLRPSPANVAAVEAATLCLIDRARGAHHLRPVRSNRDLGTVAFSQVRTMVLRDYFADVRPSGQTPMSLIAVTRYPAHAGRISVGQNIAWGTGRFATPARIVSEWMASRAHREIILTGEYRDAGVAVTPAVPSVLHVGRRGATYAVEFGARHV